MVVDSDAGAGLDDIARLSRAASDTLDRNEHVVGGSYTLEVTSPGVDRPLTVPRHWRRAQRSRWHQWAHGNRRQQWTQRSRRHARHRRRGRERGRERGGRLWVQD